MRVYAVYASGQKSTYESNSESEFESEFESNSEIVKLTIRAVRLKSLPEFLLNLPNLQTLIVSGVRLNALPDWIGNLKSLQTLNLSGNPLKSLPESIGELKNLKQVGVKKCSLESLPDSIGELAALEPPNLEFLDARKNKFRNNPIPDSLTQCKNLQTARLDDEVEETLSPEVYRFITSYSILIRALLAFLLHSFMDLIRNLKF
jgi:Leucine-rich repeat (LRR) protein